MHRDIASRTVDLALSIDPEPGRVLDVGCGTGLLLRILAERLPDAERRHLVCADIFSLWLTPTLVFGHRGRARTRWRATALVEGAGLHGIIWHRLYHTIISAVVATR